MKPRPFLRGVVAAAVAVGALTACTVGPDFHGPPPQASPPRYGSEPSDTPSKLTQGAVDEVWWSSFGDPELSSLVERLARQNLDLKAAAERVIQARATRRITRAQGLPQINGQASYMRERDSETGINSLLVPAPGAQLTFDVDDTSLQASWELDLFGRVRRAVEASDANVDVQVQARRDLALTAVADLAQTYLQLRAVQEREAVVQRNLAAADVRRKLVNDRLRNGVATLSDIAQADAQAAAIGEDLPSLHAQDSQLINALGVLLALPPRALEKELRPPPGQPPVAQPGSPPSVPTGLPSELLRRRPDIRQAEANLHIATAETGVAVAEFYPDVSLTGSYGNNSLSTTQLFDAASRMFMAGPSVSLPIFQGGRLRGQLQLRRSQEREAALTYRRTVLQAWREVDDALTSYAETQHRLKNIEHVRDDDRTALRVAEQRYFQGVETFIDVTAAQANVFRDEDQVAQARADISAALVRLYRALGGGWRTVEAIAPG